MTFTLQLTSSYRHRESGRVYTRLERPGRKIGLKHPTTRAWLEAVLYQSEETGDLYVREASDFARQFEAVVPLGPVAPASTRG